MATDHAIASRIVRRMAARLNNPRPILNVIKRFLDVQAKNAFSQQRFGEIPWSARYPYQQPPKVNVAGVVADLARGVSPKKRRFEDRPANIDTGILRKSISSTITGTTITQGTTIPYAQRAHAGGESIQPITGEVRRGLARFLRSKRGKPYRKNLGFLFARKALVTKVHPRPFLGLTGETESKIMVFLRDAFEGRRAASGNG